MTFRLVPKSVTLNDLERRNGHYFALFQRIFMYDVAVKQLLGLHRFQNLLLILYEPQSRFARLWLDMIIAQSDAHNFDAVRSMLNSLTQIQRQQRSSRRPSRRLTYSCSVYLYTKRWRQPPGRRRLAESFGTMHRSIC